jgi:hypothetical protein
MHVADESDDKSDGESNAESDAEFADELPTSTAMKYVDLRIMSSVHCHLRFCLSSYCSTVYFRAISSYFYPNDNKMSSTPAVSLLHFTSTRVWLGKYSLTSDIRTKDDKR